ncbi:hypothetical protein BGZ63DRAFT_431955 [Mariannaea sp. PMI_226]|nr:hypothetical protein BGZ63DRAFT_431955 [Mariannaea sp. PMI_226]
MAPQKRIASEMSPESSEMPPHKEQRRDIKKPSILAPLYEDASCADCCPSCCNGNCWESEYEDWSSICEQCQLREAREFFEDHIPHSRIIDTMKQKIVDFAEMRIRRAESEGVPLRNIYYGSDGFPTWDGAGHAHCGTIFLNIQGQRFRYVLDYNLGDLFGDKIISKGNQRISQALREGLALNNLFISPSMLPERLKHTGSISRRKPIECPSNSERLEKKQSGNILDPIEPEIESVRYNVSHSSLYDSESNSDSGFESANTSTRPLLTTPDTDTLDIDSNGSSFGSLEADLGDIYLDSSVPLESCQYCSNIQLSVTGEVISPYDDDDIYTIWLKEHYAEHTRV